MPTRPTNTFTAVIYVEREEEEIEVQVTGRVIPYDPGICSGPPEICYPPEGGEVEDVEATVAGKPFELTASELTKAEEALTDAAEKAGNDGPDPDELYDSQFDRDDEDPRECEPVSDVDY
jgi:hypothetical protein